jgi:hypothetical protein
MRSRAQFRGGFLLATALVLAAACGGTPADVPPMETAHPSAPSPEPSPTTTPEAAAPVWYPWLPPADAVDGALEVDTFVTALADVLPISPSPGAEPWRFNMGDGDPSTWPLMGVVAGGALVVTHGPVVVDGAEWYLLTPAQLAIDVPTGWARRAAEDGTLMLGPSDLPCPGTPATAAEVGARQITYGLAACYGTDDIVITGDLACDPTPSDYVTGASWLAGGTCRLEGMFRTVYGLDADTPPGTYAVTGHFNDPEAAACTSVDGAADPDGQLRLHAVLDCRSSFIATGIEPR